MNFFKSDPSPFQLFSPPEEHSASVSCQAQNNFILYLHNTERRLHYVNLITEYNLCIEECFIYIYLESSFHSCTVHLDTIESVIYPTDTQLDCSKMLKFKFRVCSSVHLHTFKLTL